MERFAHFSNSDINGFSFIKSTFIKLLLMLTQSLVYLRKTAVTFLNERKTDFCLLWHTSLKWFLWGVNDISVGTKMVTSMENNEASCIPAVLQL